MHAARKSTCIRRALSSRRYLTTHRSVRRRNRRLAFVAATLLFGVGFLALDVQPSAAANYSGTLPQAGVVWISDESKPAPLAETVMRNTHKSFEPDLAVITVGSSVRFPNDDAFFHSIYSASDSDPFDIGFYDTGPGKVVPFPRSGVVGVRCHIHGKMSATIVVVDGPWAQTHATNESYTLANVRPGGHVLHVWTADAGEKTSQVRL